MPLVMEVGLGLGHIVLDRDPVPPAQEGAQPPQCLLWPNGWMDQDAACTEVGLGPSNVVLDRDPDAPSKGHTPRLRPMSIVATVAHLSYY